MDEGTGAVGGSEHPRVPYDEFSMFHENAAEHGIAYGGPPDVRRDSVPLADGRRLSALVWGRARPQYVFLHGGAQNAHTWDTVLLALDRSAVAIDLPGHGHSDGAADGALDPFAIAADVAVAVPALAPGAGAVVGMSLGGLTALALAELAPNLVRSLVLVDITPGVTPAKSAAITSFVNGPASFPDFDAILARTIEFNPTRSISSLRRGILHNALQLEDGTWVWRYARHRGHTRTGPDRPGRSPAEGGGRAGGAGGDLQGSVAFERFRRLWDAVSGLSVPLMLVRGTLEQSVVDDADEAELLRRQPTARVEHVTNAGHSVQGDSPVELARLIADFSS